MQNILAKLKNVFLFTFFFFIGNEQLHLMFAPPQNRSLWKLNLKIFILNLTYFWAQNYFIFTNCI